MPGCKCVYSYGDLTGSLRGESYVYFYFHGCTGEVWVQKRRQNNTWHLSLASVGAFSMVLSAHIGLSYGLHPAREMDSHRKNSDMSGNLEQSMKACRANVSVFVPLFSFSLSLLPFILPSIQFWVEHPHLSRAIWTHLHFRLPWQPARHSEDPPFNVSVFSSPAPSFSNQRGQGS